MKRYRLIETTTLYEKEILQEGMLAGITGKRVKMDWNKVEQELGSEVPNEIKQKYEKLYGSASFKIVQYLALAIALGGFISITVVLRELFAGNSIGLKAGSSGMVALLAVYASVIVSMLLYVAARIAHGHRVNKCIAHYETVKGIDSDETRQKLKKAWELMENNAEGTGETVSGIRWVVTALLIMTAAVLAVGVHAGYTAIPEGAKVIRL